MKFKFIYLFLSATILLQAQVPLRHGFGLGKPTGTETTMPLGNGIVDILAIDSTVWVSSGYGLSKTQNRGNNWTIFTSQDYMAKGGVSAMTSMDDQTIWIALAYDSTIQDESLPVGGGLSYSSDNGQSWIHVPQPVDSLDVVDYKPTTTRVQNLTYDITALDSTLWITSFGGGLRKSEDMGKTWQVVTTDGLDFSALDHLNHRAFSVMTENGNVWVGTAHGISKSTDGGNTWRRFTHLNQQYPISGNFVVALAYQQATGTVWAATIEATDTSEVRGVSKTNNGGETWEVMLEGKFPHNFGFDGETVYAACDEGLFVSNDEGESWYILPAPQDFQTDEEILTEVYYSAGVSLDNNGKTLWIGSADGLASTNDNGNSWRLHRSFQSTREAGNPNTYAYPSPFSPSRHDYVRFQYDISRAGEVKIEIYDFAMDRVASFTEYETSPLGNSQDRSAKWDGKSDDGKYAASGVYFFKVKVEGKTSWGKIVIIN